MYYYQYITYQTRSKIGLKIIVVENTSEHIKWNSIFSYEKLAKELVNKIFGIIIVLEYNEVNRIFSDVT